MRRTPRISHFAQSIRPYFPPFLWRPLRTVWVILRDWRDYRDGLLFEISGGVYRSKSAKFVVPKRQTRLPHRARFWRDTHELEERTLVERYLPSDATVLELGACLGVVSVAINRKLSRPRRHIAVEPNPDLTPVLENNRVRNRAEFTIEPALVARHSSGTFFVADLITTSSASHEIGRKVSVPVKTVEQLEDDHGLTFDALVMDIQGGELELLRENQDFLTRCRCVVLELHPHVIGEEHCAECRDLLRQQGLHLAERQGLVEAWIRGISALPSGTRILAEAPANYLPGSSAASA